MTEQAKEQRRAYRREWYRANRDKVRAYQEKHWEKLAHMQAETEEKGNHGNE